MYAVGMLLRGGVPPLIRASAEHANASNITAPAPETVRGGRGVPASSSGRSSGPGASTVNPRLTIVVSRPPSDRPAVWMLETYSGSRAQQVYSSAPLAAHLAKTKEERAIAFKRLAQMTLSETSHAHTQWYKSQIADHMASPAHQHEQL